MFLVPVKFQYLSTTETAQDLEVESLKFAAAVEEVIENAVDDSDVARVWLATVAIRKFLLEVIVHYLKEAN
ncbi:hypothetical protein TASIC1_0003074600 [Trichoderma asperellum]|uniref:Uncharacterized protein n=1 Tax=Trichoderma asperellum TaxID=101201 RepID=A0A6V8QRD8_TRIAP|nr:hypothetical protein TASIC1_0003074600 [Trichoderma asperellum]